MWFKNTVLLFLLLVISCGKANKLDLRNDNQDVETPKMVDSVKHKPIIVGANQTKNYLHLLKGKRIGIVANQTSVIFKNKNYTHIVDSLVSLKVDVKKIFAPEHGFRGTADAGEMVKDGLDIKTGLPVFSLHGKNKKPTNAQLEDIDILLFDIQDVGARFYTYISSLHYVMEACAENNVRLLVLDRPNPHGHYIDGPILEPEHKSFIGMHPIPVVHGMTIGEYAQMINGEHWLKNGATCNLSVITIKNYNHNSAYKLPIKPSPNLPNAQAVNLYPSLCFLEGTNVSVGRGTDLQFQIYGAPFLPKTDFNFTPKPNIGANYPKHENSLCNGYNLTNEPRQNELNLSYIINAYAQTEDKSNFFLKNAFINKLAGTKQLQKQIEAGLSEDKIKATWQSGLNDFKKIRAKYLLY